MEGPELNLTPEQLWHLATLADAVLDRTGEVDHVPHSERDRVLLELTSQFQLEHTEFTGQSSTLVVRKPLGDFAISARWSHELIYRPINEPYKSFGHVLLRHEGQPLVMLPEQADANQVYGTLVHDLQSAP